MIYPLYVAAPPKHPLVEFHSLKREQLAEEISFPIGKTLSASMIPHRPSWLNKRPPPAVTTGGDLLFQGFDEVSSQCFALGDSLIVRGVLYGEAVVEEFGSSPFGAFCPCFHPGTATPAIGAEKCHGNILPILPVPTYHPTFALLYCKR